MAGTNRITTGQLSGPATTFYLDADLLSQSIDGNYSIVRCWLRNVSGPSGATSSSNYSNTGYQIGYVNGNEFGRIQKAPFLQSGFGNGGVRWDNAYDVVVYHNADGTGSAALRMLLSYGNISRDLSASLSLPTIPRATTPTLTPDPIDAGTEMTIGTPRASGSFTHEVSYAFGTKSGVIATGVALSTTWTPPMSLLSEIPSTPTGQGTITVKTFSGATLIGTKSKAFTLQVPASVVPTFTTVTHSEAVAGMDTLVGAYVQGLSKLNLALIGAAGAYGSTISSYKITVAGQTINSASGVTPAVLANSGTVNIVGTVTDSRGRSASQTIPITVLAYAPPSIDTNVFQINRADAGGTIDPDGDRIRIDLKASVQSLVAGGTEKNALTYKVYTRLRDADTWELKETITPGGVAFNSYILISPYAVENSWEVRVDVLDKFVAAVIQGIVATAAIFMHWGDGLGVGKFWEQGGLDVKEQIYQNDGARVLDESDLESISSTQLPAGSILAWTTNTAPANWLLCQGQAVSRTTYASLFAQIGTQYGVGDNATTFNVPDLRGRVPVGLDPTQTEFDTLGEFGGAKTHTLTTAEIPSHTHPDYQINYSVLRENGGTFVGGTTLPVTRSGTTGFTGGDGAHNNLQPYRVVNYIIKATNGDTPGDSQLTQRVSVAEGKLARGWEPAIPASVAANGGTVSVDSTTGTVTVDAGCVAVRLDGLFEPGYEYELLLDLQVDSGHSTDNSAWMRMAENGVQNSVGQYNTAGSWAQYNATWGAYTVNGGNSGAIGPVSGAGIYVDFMTTIRLRPWTASGFGSKGFFYTFQSFTGGSARGAVAGGYTPGATNAFDGILFLFNGAGTGKARGKIRAYKRSLS